MAQDSKVADSKPALRAAPDKQTRTEKASPQAKMRAAEIPQGKVAQLDPGWIEGYTAVFGNIDLVNERFVPGAFTKTIKERMAAGKVKLMSKHIAHGGGTSEIIGTITQAKEDDYGLWYHAVLSRTRTAQEIRQNVLDGHIGFNSIGYITMDFEDVESAVDGKSVPVRDLKEAAWWDTVVTTIPVNELASITGAKAEGVLEVPVGDVSKDIRQQLDENRDAIEAKATELNTLVTDRMELIAPSTEDEDAESDSKDTPDADKGKSEMVAANEKRKEALEAILSEV